MTMDLVRKILDQAKAAGMIEWIYFEGGEPFLYYQVMLAGINLAAEFGFKIGVVTNSYWATSDEDVNLWLTPLIGKVQDLTISSDLFHYSEKVSQQSQRVARVASELKIPVGIICIEKPDLNAFSVVGQLPQETSSIMFRGRAAEKLSYLVPHKGINKFNNCPHEDLIDPGRVHIDPFGNMHICQGISLGNINEKSIVEICKDYAPEKHQIIGPLLAGGPYQLVQEFDLDVKDDYADACHLCYEARKLLREKFPNILIPDQMYGVID
jgi:hypothetical protein